MNKNTEDIFHSVGLVVYYTLFSFITRILLCVWLFFTEPLSLHFRYLIIIIFCLPILRYVVSLITKERLAISENYIILYFLMPVLYIFVCFKILRIYDFPFLLNLAIFLPVLMLFSLHNSRAIINDTSNFNNFLVTMGFYILPFLSAVNYSFDFTAPKASEKYYITDILRYNELSYDSDNPEIANTIFYLIPMNKNSKPPFWKKVSYGDYWNYSNLQVGFDKIITLNNKDYKVIDYYDYKLLLIEYKKPVRMHIKESIAGKYKKGDYLTIEIHQGLFGVEWKVYK